MSRIFILFILCMVSVAAFAGFGISSTGDVTRYVPWAGVIGLKACGVDSRDSWKILLPKAAASAVVTVGTVYVMKETIHEWRPDYSDRKSFPSGHTAFAFAGAANLHHQYGHVSPWISIGGYAVATFTAVDRVCRDRHHWYDTVAGAAVGLLSAKLSFFIGGKLFPKADVNVTVGPMDVSMCYSF
ncbi:phosphatase PAP2 family protein [Xylanibacter muris]|uniref:Phosphatase PAP2 family protein n=1 Tax=Xylanibacter muris TaxID=2736290 RepID=A0ABX2AMI0_9BACT|nr:phosphatase PAP2 family protein [Xylanibacter muris]NPD92436.1 phosphatase PAP2 family protein [Xylanibacter muris]